MTIESDFSTSQGRRDQNPNKVLAQKICQSTDHEAINELIQFLKRSPDTDLLFDALKTLEMIGEKEPELAKPAFDSIVPFLKHKTNKIVWMAMSALSQITQYYPKKTFDHLELLVSIMDSGSVITRDKGFKILTDLYKTPKFREILTPLLEEQLLMAPANQLGQYAEKWMEVAQNPHFINIKRALEARYNELQNPDHKKRVEKNLKKLNKFRLGKV